MEKVNDPIKRLICAVGVQGSQAQVTRLGESDGVLHGFAITHLSNENDIRGLTQLRGSAGLLPSKIRPLGIEFGH